MDNMGHSVVLQVNMLFFFMVFTLEIAGDSRPVKDGQGAPMRGKTVFGM
jgi:hypothetical protein